MELGYEIYIRLGKDEEPVPLESITPEKKVQLGKEFNDTFLRAAGYTPLKTT